jgi:hypothetical protein
VGLPVRGREIAAGFVDTPLSASLDEQLEERRNQLRATLPIGRLWPTWGGRAKWLLSGPVRRPAGGPAPVRAGSARLR